MDTTAVLIATGGTLLFLGVLVYKLVWFMRKVNEAPGEGPAAGLSDGERGEAGEAENAANAGRAGSSGQEQIPPETR